MSKAENAGNNGLRVDFYSRLKRKFDGRNIARTNRSVKLPRIGQNAVTGRNETKSSDGSRHRGAPTSIRQVTTPTVNWQPASRRPER